MKTCILINGNTRTIDKCIDNISDTFDFLSPDYFISTYDLKYGYHPAVKNNLNYYEDIYLTEQYICDLYNKINVKGMLIEKHNESLNFYKAEKEKFNHKFLNLESSFLQYMKIKNGINIIEKYENINNFQYDLIIKTRNDIIHKKIEYDFTTLLNSNIVIVSDKNVFPNDCIIISARNNFIKIINNMVDEFYHAKYINSEANPPHGLLEASAINNGMLIQTVEIMNYVARINTDQYYG